MEVAVFTEVWRLGEKEETWRYLMFFPLSPSKMYKQAEFLLILLEFPPTNQKPAMSPAQGEKRK